VLEDVVALELEASCIVARDGRGGEVAFPVFENAHAAHILDVTVVPARVPPAVAEWMREIAIAAARKLDVVGLLTTEFFLTSKSAARSNARRVEGCPSTDDVPAVLELAEEELVAERLLHVVLDDARERARAVVRVVALLGEVGARGGASPPS
jgi:hypothetical protein